MIGAGAALRKIEFLAARPSHAAAWLRWRREPAAVRHNPLKPLGVQELRARLETCGSDLRREDFKEYRWFLRKGGRLVGEVGLVFASDRRSAEAGVMVSERFQGRGIATAAVERLVDMVFSQTLLSRLEAFIDRDNMASRRVFEKLGFLLQKDRGRMVKIRGRSSTQLVYILNRGSKRRAGP